MQRYPRWAATMARPTPVLPLVGSTMTPPGFKSPSRSAASIIVSAGRSFELPPGFIDSSFTSTSTPWGVRSRLNRTRGVSPIRSSREFATRMAAAYLERRTGQGDPEDASVFRGPEVRRIGLIRDCTVTDAPLDDRDADPSDDDDQPEGEKSVDEHHGQCGHLLGTVGDEYDGQAALDQTDAARDDRQRRDDLGHAKGEQYAAPRDLRVHRTETADQNDEVHQPEGGRHHDDTHGRATRQRYLAHPLQCRLDTRHHVTARMSGQSSTQSYQHAQEAKEQITSHEQGAGTHDDDET